LREGDTNTKFFHLQAYQRGHKIFIDHQSHMGGSVVDEAGKAQLLFEHFYSIQGTHQDRSVYIDFDKLNLLTHQLSTLDRCFSEEEIWQVIRSLPPDKVPGPDGFFGLFYQTTWPVIKQDIMNAIHALWSKDFRSFYLLNQAYHSTRIRRMEWFLLRWDNTGENRDRAPWLLAKGDLKLELRGMKNDSFFLHDLGDERNLFCSLTAAEMDGGELVMTSWFDQLLAMAWATSSQAPSLVMAL
jgi:hypothetical protein